MLDLDKTSCVSSWKQKRPKGVSLTKIWEHFTAIFKKSILLFSGLLESNLAIVGQKWGVHSGLVTILLQGHNNVSRDKIEWPVYLWSMFLACGSKLEFLEKPHTCTGRTCRPHRKEPAGTWIRAYLLWDESTNHCETMLPNSNNNINKWLDMNKTLFEGQSFKLLNKIQLIRKNKIQ